MTFERVWTDEMIETVAKLAPYKKASEIGKIMKKSRNAVIGICDREGIKLGKPPQGPRKRKLRSFRQKNVFNLMPKKSSVPVPLEKEIFHPSINLIDRSASQCGWIIGEPRNLKCCGLIIYKGVYCQTHYQTAYKNA